MKKEYKILLVVLMGILTLFFFPEPQTNFIYYLIAAFVFGIIIWQMNKRLK